MGVGICVVTVGLIVGLSFDNLKVESTYLLVGLVLFCVGQLMQKSKK